MPTNRTRGGRLRAVASAVVGLLLVGGAASPARADSTRSQQWHLDAMHAEEMWGTSTGKGITVAVIDTGVDPDNPDLEGQVLDGRDLATSRPGDEHTDYLGHGTSMAGLIAGTGGYGGGNGAYGLAPGAKIFPIRVPTQSDDPTAGFAFAGVLSKAIRLAADADAQVINVSLASTNTSDDLAAAVKYALDRGSLVFAGVGNSGDEGNPVFYPAATPGVVAVAAVGRDLRRTDESVFGPQVDMAAPGEDMVHACGGRTGLCKSHGTSDATALASASAALIWSEHPTWTNNQVLRVMLNTIGAPTDGAKRNDSIGYGIVRPRIALQDPGDPGPADVYPLPDLEAAGSPASPSGNASASESTQAPAKADDSGSDASGAKGSGNVSPWVVPGIGAAVVLAALAAAVVVLRRRSRPGTVPPPPSVRPAQQTPYGGGQLTPPGPGGTPQSNPYHRQSP
ncbi:type VII secretion-associated serine protease mycosin [Streptomyces pharetrae]|uniref:type VII secretion-associated serine protease mycosin n=1 Tax=Streptomyces pharetrae TaxID=291370 RepID=UPI0036596F39